MNLIANFVNLLKITNLYKTNLKNRCVNVSDENGQLGPEIKFPKVSSYKYPEGFLSKRCRIADNMLQTLVLDNLKKGIINQRPDATGAGKGF